VPSTQYTRGSAIAPALGFEQSQEREEREEKRRKRRKKRNGQLKFGALFFLPSFLSLYLHSAVGRLSTALRRSIHSFVNALKKIPRGRTTGVFIPVCSVLQSSFTFCLTVDITVYYNGGDESKAVRSY
jgi:hypothetical protein